MARPEIRFSPHVQGGGGNIPEDSLTPEGTQPEIPDVSWEKLTPNQTQFVYALLDFVHDGVQAGDNGSLAKQRVLTARDKLSQITRLAEQNKDWDVYSVGGYETFHNGTQGQRQAITRGRASDDLLSASFAVMYCEGRFYGLLGDIVKASVWDQWQQGLQGEEAKDYLSQWTERNYQAGKKAALASRNP